MVEILTLLSNIRGRILKINHTRFLLELGRILTSRRANRRRYLNFMGSLAFEFCQ
jgi:hypothetical protein